MIEGWTSIFSMTIVARQGPNTQTIPHAKHTKTQDNDPGSFLVWPVKKDHKILEGGSGQRQKKTEPPTVQIPLRVNCTIGKKVGLGLGFAVGKPTTRRVRLLELWLRLLEAMSNCQPKNCILMQGEKKKSSRGGINKAHSTSHISFYCTRVPRSTTC